MSGVLGAHAGAPETYTWTWRSRWPCPAMDERRTQVASRPLHSDADVAASTWRVTFNGHVQGSGQAERTSAMFSDPPPLRPPLAGAWARDYPSLHKKITKAAR